jgi:hypothetical protein
MLSIAQVVLVAGLSLLTAAISNPSSTTARTATSLCTECSGCVATPLTDPVTGMVNGVQVMVGVSGFRFTDYSVTATSSTCRWEVNVDGQPICAPQAPCQFEGKFKAYSNYPFRDNASLFPGCHWSAIVTLPNPLGGTGWTGHCIEGSIAWIAACDDGTTWRDRWFYDQVTPGDCYSGQLCAQIQFAGICTKCTP